MKWSSAPILPILCVSNEVPAGLESSVFSSSQKSSGGSQVSFSVNYATADPYGSTDHSLYLCESIVFRLSIPMRPLFLCKLSRSSIKVVNTMDKIYRFGGLLCFSRATAFQDRLNLSSAYLLVEASIRWNLLVFEIEGRAFLLAFERSTRLFIQISLLFSNLLYF